MSVYVFVRTYNMTYTCHISSSEYSPMGSILLRTVPSNRTGS